MKKDELVKLGLDEEIAKKVETASVDELKGFIPKVSFDEVNTEKNALQAALKERDSQLETLKKSTGDVEGLRAQIGVLQADNQAKDAAHAAEIKQLRVDTAIDTALSAAKAKNLRAVKALLDLDFSKAELAEDGSIKGLSDQIKKLQGAEDSKFLFDTEAKKTTFKGAKPGEPSREDLDNKVDTSKMSYEELCTFLASNPEAATQL